MSKPLFLNLPRGVGLCRRRPKYGTMAMVVVLLFKDTLVPGRFQPFPMMAPHQGLLLPHI